MSSIAYVLRLALLIVVAPATAIAADRVPVGATPAWVTPVALPAERKADGAVDPRLLDVQARIVDGHVDAYFRQVTRALTSDGLIVLGNFGVVWKPGTSAVTVHSATITRDGRRIDVLGDGSRFQVIRREANLDRLQLDGVLTAIMPITDLRVGDVIETSYSIRVDNPVLGRDAEFDWTPPSNVNFGRVFIRGQLPADGSARYRLGAIAKPLATTEANGFVIDKLDYSFPAVPNGAPARFAAQTTMTLSSFASWQDVARAMRPLYATATQTADGGAVAAEAERIAAATPDPVARATAALALVQRQVRYFARVDGLGGYKPELAEAVWAARAGDCKGKTALLVALLRRLGITAEPALVSATRSDGLAESLPMPARFDHVIVRAFIKGKTYWLDGSRTGDRSIDSVTIDDYRYALPIETATNLVALTPTMPVAPLEDWRLDLDARAGIDTPAKATASVILREDSATQVRTMMSFMSAEVRETFLRKLWSDRHDWIDVTSVDQRFDDATGDLTLTMTGSGKMDWNTGPASQNRYEANKMRLGQTLAPDRTDETKNLAPVAIASQFAATRQTILLPDEGRGYAIEGENIDTTIGGLHYRRTATLKDGRFDVAATTQSAAGELSYADAKLADAKMNEVFQKQLFVRLPVVAAKPRRPGKAQEATLISGSISDDDYPNDALAARASGRSVVTFDIGTDGRVRSCRTTSTSNYKVLDDRTCALITERFTYAAALDRAGRPVPETKMQAVKWRLPEGTIDLKPFSARLTYIVDEKGATSGCETVVSPPDAHGPGWPGCGQAAGAIVRGPDGKPMRAKVTIEQSIRYEPLSASDAAAGEVAATPGKP